MTEAHDHRLDELDRRILHSLMEDSRNTTATGIADQANVSGATIRNRIQKLEDLGIIRDYTTHIDFERAGGKLTNLYLCNVPVPEREALAHEARNIPGVVHVRSLMTGRRNLHVKAIGEDTKDLKQVARQLSQLGIEIEDEDLIEDERFDAYSPFNPTDGVEIEHNDFISLTGDSDVVEVNVAADAPIAGSTIEEASTQGIIDDETLIIGIERDDQELTPRGETVIQSDDIVTLLSRQRADEDTLAVFQGPQTDPVDQGG